MKRLAPLLLLVACTAAPPPAPTPAAADAAPEVHGLTIEEEARVLAMEDRREYDSARVMQWMLHSNPLHRARMALALARIGPHVFEDKNGNGVRDAGETQVGIEILSALHTDPDRNVREVAAFALGEIGDPAGVKALIEYSGDDDGAVAAEAMEALSKLTKEFPLAAYAISTEPKEREGVRARTVRYLFRYGTDEASAIAANALADGSSVVRQEAAYTLARRPYAPARERLELLRTDNNTLTRAYVAAALGRIAAKESVLVLLEMFGDAHPWVRTNALVALSRVAAKDASFVNANDVPRILAITEDPDPGTRASSIELLGFYAAKNETARKRLTDISVNGSRWDRELAAAALARQFGEAAANLTGWGKVRLLESLAARPEGAPARKRLATDTDSMVRANVLSSLPDEQVDAEIDLVRAGLADADVIVRANAIAKYAESKNIPATEKVATLRPIVDSERGQQLNDARAAAMASLSTINFPEREAWLRSLLTDDDPVIRRIAADGIEQDLKMPRPQYTPLPVTRSEAEYQEIVRWSRTPHTATIHMTRGNIEVQLLTQDAPMTAWNFAQLAKKKYFDNSTFMRVVPNFVIQGGDPRNDQNGGPGYSIRDEMNLQKYTRGAVGMALSGPDTGGSQFFITHSPQPHLDGGYTIFGRVSDGMGGVVDQTERGDLVQTITIDERGPAAAADLSSVQNTPLPTEIGRITPAQMLSRLPEYSDRKTGYTPDDAVLETLATAVQPNDRVEVYMGTWCPDSQREVPKFLKIVDVLKDRYSKELPASFVALDRAKSRPSALIDGKHIDKVATFIWYRGERELGRVVEKPTGLLEDDLLVIAAKQ